MPQCIMSHVFTVDHVTYGQGRKTLDNARRRTNRHGRRKHSPVLADADRLKKSQEQESATS